jgi:hypothetical protein
MAPAVPTMLMILCLRLFVLLFQATMEMVMMDRMESTMARFLKDDPHHDGAESDDGDGPCGIDHGMVATDVESTMADRAAAVALRP